MKKTRLEDLAVFGGAPAFAQPIHVGRPNVGDRARFLARVNEALDRQWLTNDGPLVRELETRIAQYLGVEHCIAVCNATVGMEVLARALALSGEVIVPAFTFVATAHAFAWVGLQPVFCDVNAATHTLDPADVARVINQSTSAVMGVHLWGNPCDVQGLKTAVRPHGARLFFDAAHAFATDVDGRRVGTFGGAEVFSFHATKFFNSFEGGAITTNDASLARELRLMRNFGFAGYDAVATMGTNAKMNEVSAAMGLTSLDAIDELLATNAARFRDYADRFDGVAGIRMLHPPPGVHSNKQYVVLEIADAGLTRDQLLAVLWAENVRARRYFFPGCHRVPPYDRPDARSLPVTERLVEQVLVLPAGGAVTAADVEHIYQLISFALANADQIRDRVAPSIPPGGLHA